MRRKLRLSCDTTTAGAFVFWRGRRSQGNAASRVCFSRSLLAGESHTLSHHAADWVFTQSSASEPPLNLWICSIVPSGHSASTCHCSPSFRPHKISDFVPSHCHRRIHDGPASIPNRAKRTFIERGSRPVLCLLSQRFKTNVKASVVNTTIPQAAIITAPATIRCCVSLGIDLPMLRLPSDHLAK